ncbi:hypothetical protein WA026_021460 [Henosepilachna vigintioctopunctata]|uniref:Uncharacterized protein n=1 Tax=Henosepilachna vigintioctopunctata TaxID=420089 RepID=A0AAW1UNQ6_9CUCU
MFHGSTARLDFRPLSEAAQLRAPLSDVGEKRDEQRTLPSVRWSTFTAMLITDPTNNIEDRREVAFDSGLSG